MLALVLVSSAFGGLRGFCFSYATSLVDRSVRRDLYRSIVQQEIAFFDKAQSGKLNLVISLKLIAFNLYKALIFKKLIKFLTLF